MREDLLIWVRDYCKDQTLQDEGAISVFLDRAVAWLNAHVAGVASESLGDYSVTFSMSGQLEQNLPISLVALLRPYKKVKLL